jgi:hypothetical protein
VQFLDRLRLAVSLAADLVLAASRRAIGMVDEDVVVAGGADDAVDGFRERVVSGVVGGVLAASESAVHGHDDDSILTATRRI